MTVEYRMARGFESKDVEFQQAEAERARVPRRPMTAEEHARTERCRVVELSLTRVRADLLTATSPAHRQMLAHAIAALEAQLSNDACC
jgi:hypothetical protein